MCATTSWTSSPSAEPHRGTVAQGSGGTFDDPGKTADPDLQHAPFCHSLITVESRKRYGLLRMSNVE